MTDPFVLRAVIVFLGLTVLSCVVGVFLLASQGIDTSNSDLLVAAVGLGGTALGALGSMLTNTSGRVTIDNPPSNPVPVADSDEVLP